jgi:hypothetical protein
VVQVDDRTVAPREPSGAAVAASTGGPVLVLWWDSGPDEIHTRAFDGALAPLTDSLRLAEEVDSAPAVAALTDGTFAAAWLSGGAIEVVHVGLLAPPQPGSTSVLVELARWQIEPPAVDTTLHLGRASLAAAPEGDLWVGWASSTFIPFGGSFGLSSMRRFTAGGEPVTEQVGITFFPSALLVEAPSIASAADGQGAAATWQQNGTVRLLRVTPEGAAAEPQIVVAEASNAGSLPVPAVSSGGHTAVVYRVGTGPISFPPLIELVVVGPTGTPLGFPSLLATGTSAANVTLPAVAWGDSDTLLTAWWEEGLAASQLDRALVRPFGLGCDALTLCLGDDRFEVQIEWDDPFNGGGGAGNPIPLTGDSGAFWFFDPASYEVLVKVVDGRAVNGHFWVFYGSLSNVEYRITVTDRTTELQQTYTNPPFTFGSRADVTAFADGAPPLAPPPAPTGSSTMPAELPAPGTTTGEGCPVDATCLADGRFAARIAWQDHRSGSSGAGLPLPLTGDTGGFWFFNPEILEVVVKIVDGRTVNGHFWVFYASLTDLAFTLTLEDLATGQMETYTNPPGVLASDADVRAFAGGP